MAVVTQLSIHFPGGKTCHLEKERKRLISPTSFIRFSSRFQENDNIVSGHVILVTDDIENVGQC